MDTFQRLAVFLYLVPMVPTCPLSLGSGFVCPVMKIYGYGRHKFYLHFEPCIIQIICVLQTSSSVACRRRTIFICSAQGRFVVWAMFAAVVGRPSACAGVPHSWDPRPLSQPPGQYVGIPWAGGNLWEGMLQHFLEELLQGPAVARVRDAILRLN